jgi:6,7-dimethyl-8-ribityllumazine synthase
MSLSVPQSQSVNGATFKVGIVASRFNEKLVDALLQRAISVLEAAGVKSKNIQAERVPGSHEIPWAAQELARAKDCDVVIALGVLIGGDTNHHEMVGQSVSTALQNISLKRKVPVINGVIVANTLAQARARCTDKINRGAEFAQGALEMAALKRKLKS